MKIARRTSEPGQSGGSSSGASSQRRTRRGSFTRLGLVGEAGRRCAGTSLGARRWPHTWVPQVLCTRPALGRGGGTRECGSATDGSKHHDKQAQGACALKCSRSSEQGTTRTLGVTRGVRLRVRAFGGKHTIGPGSMRAHGNPQLCGRHDPPSRRRQCKATWRRVLYAGRRLGTECACERCWRHGRRGTKPSLNTWRAWLGECQGHGGARNTGDCMDAKETDTTAQVCEVLCALLCGDATRLGT